MSLKSMGPQWIDVRTTYASTPVKQAHRVIQMPETVWFEIPVSSVAEIHDRCVEATSTHMHAHIVQIPLELQHGSTTRRMPYDSRNMVASLHVLGIGVAK
jgi:hypothetical protein